MFLPRCFLAMMLIAGFACPLSAQQVDLDKLNQQALEAVPYGLGYQPCDQMPNTIAVIECVGQKTDAWDNRLNAVYGQLRSRLKEWGRQDQVIRLRDAQRAWIAYRDQNCAYYAHVGGSIGRIEAAECLRSMTAARAIELERALLN
ncbi:MAG: lysozyme inhibitor LprI family protein [Stappiaceae bacterium]